MQDLHTGELREFDPAFFKNIPESPMPPPFQNLQERLQAAADAAIPVREHQGPTFAIGEEITVKGGRFRVSGITSKRIYLDSLPSIP